MSSFPLDRANTLKAAFRPCDVAPLVGDNIDKYYVELSKVRNTEAIESINTRLDFLEPADAIKQEQFNLERSIPTQNYADLAQVCSTKDVTKDEIGTLMLFNLWVFEYNGNNRWNYVNPIVMQSNAFQEQIKAFPNHP